MRHILYRLVSAFFACVLPYLCGTRRSARASTWTSIETIRTCSPWFLEGGPRKSAAIFVVQAVLTRLRKFHRNEEEKNQKPVQS